MVMVVAKDADVAVAVSSAAGAVLAAAVATSLPAACKRTQARTRFKAIGSWSFLSFAGRPRLIAELNAIGRARPPSVPTKCSSLVEPHNRAPMIQ